MLEVYQATSTSASANSAANCIDLEQSEDDDATIDLCDDDDLCEQSNIIYLYGDDDDDDTVPRRAEQSNIIDLHDDDDDDDTEPRHSDERSPLRLRKRRACEPEVDDERPPLRSRTRRKHHSLRNDWQSLMSDRPKPKYDGPSLVYLLRDTSNDKVYTGAAIYDPAEITLAQLRGIVTSHRAGARVTTRHFNISTTRVEFTIRGFPNLPAAMRFERLVKKKGARRGLVPKLTAAQRELSLGGAAAHPLLLVRHYS